MYPLLLVSLVCVLVVTGVSLTSLWGWARGLYSSHSRRSNGLASGAGHSRSLSRAVEMYERRQQQLQQQGGGAGAGAPSTSLDASAQSLSAAEESEWSEVEDSLLSSSSSGGLSSHRMPLPSRSLPQRLWAWLASPATATWSWRCVHRRLGVAVFLPFSLTALTGGLFIVAGDWLGWERATYRSLMYLHEGRYIEASGTLYAGLLGAAVLALSTAGCAMLWARQCAASAGGAAASMTTRHASSASFPASSPSSMHASTSESNLSGGGASAFADSNNSNSAFVSPSAETRRTMARIHAAFLEPDGGQTTGGETEAEDELAAGTSDS